MASADEGDVYKRRVCGRKAAVNEREEVMKERRKERGEAEDG